MIRLSRSPRALAAVGVAVGALTVLWLTLFVRESLRYCDRFVFETPSPGRIQHIGPICDHSISYEGGWVFGLGFEPHYLLIGAAMAAATYAVLVLAVLSVRAISGKATAE